MKRGASLVTVILVTTVVMTLGFTAASMSTSNLLLTNQAVHQMTARNLAESAIAKAIARLQDDPAFGTTAATQNLTVEFSHASAGAGGYLSFDKTGAGPYSTNNLDTDNSVAGWHNTVVPGQTVHLVGTGKCAGATHSVETILFLSRFPYAIASSGPIRSHGGLQVASLDDTAEAGNGPKAGHQPGSLASNSNDLSQAVQLNGNDIDVSGDVQAAGAIELGPQVHVGGAVRPNHDPVGLPKMDIADLDTLGKPGVAQLSQDSFPALTVEGFTRIDRRLAITSGGLDLNNGVLYVDGDLSVHGGIRGTGAVISTGSVQVVGGGTASEGKAALISKGDITLEGSAQQSQSFSGLLYTEGNLSSKYVELSGVFVANRQGSEGSQVQLEHTKVFQTGDPSIDFVVQPASPTPTSSPSPPPAVALTALGAVALGTSPGGTMQMARAVVNVSSLPMDPASGHYLLPPNPLSAVMWNLPTGVVPAGQTSEIAYQNGMELTPYLQANANLIPSMFTALEPELLNQLNLRLATLNDNLPAHNPTAPSATPSPGTGTAPAGTERWSLDLSRFIQKRDRMRILMWREL